MDTRQDRSERRIGSAIPFILAGLALIGAVWAVTRNARADSEPTPRPMATSTVDEAARLELPPFSVADDPSRIVRHSDLTTTISQGSRLDVIRYTVQTGDSVFGIADRFGLTPETILWGNYDELQDDPHSLRPGIELNVLPVDGIYYQWQEGDQLAGVAAAFEADVDDIMGWPGNAIDPADPTIEPGTWIVIPDGQREFQQWLVPTIARGSAGVGTAYGSGGCVGDFSGGAVGTGGFIWPTVNHYLSGNDYWSGHLAIDIAAGLGASIWAADSGVVVYAGWSNNGYGNMVMLDHGNGWQTLYAHLSAVNVGCGQSVGQGQLIGLGGSTGNSTGPHLHFETRFEGGFVNPWYVLP